MSAADKLAQVLAEHQADYQPSYGFCCSCLEVCRLPEAGFDATIAAHQAAVVLTHLTAEGWAQGWEEWGYGATGGYDGTYVRPTSNEAEARDRAQINDCGVFRRRVTDWEPVETGDQK